MASSVTCGTHTVFACLEHEQCTDGERSGTCQPTGYCSFDDPSCSSGQRYGAHAGQALAGTCVDDPSAETSDGATVSSAPETETTDSTSASDETTGDRTDDTGCPEVQWHRDADGDGFGDPDEVAVACAPPSGFVEDGTDCDDDDPRVNPANLGCPNPASLVGWWRFDGDDGVFDDSSGHRNHGTAVGGPTSGVAGAYRQALRLDGSSDAVDVAGVASSLAPGGSPPGTGTLEAWVLSDGPTETCVESVNCAELLVHVGPTEDPDVEPFHHVDGFGPHAEAHLHLFFDEVSAAWSYAMYVGNDDANCQPSSANTDRFLVEGEWTHVAGTWSGGVCRLYVDGLLVDEAPLAATPPGHWDAAIIGTVIDHNRRWLHGAIDEVMIFSEARTPDQIRADCGAPQCQP